MFFVSFNTLSSGEVLVVTPAELNELLGPSERTAFNKHQHSIRAILSVAGVRFFETSHHLERPNFRVEDPLVALGDSAVKSVMLEHLIIEDDITELETRFGGYEGDWRIKSHDDPFGSNLRFFVAKAPFAEVTLDDQTTADIVQRRTYASISTDGTSSPRLIDIKQALGSATRHSTDQRGDVFIAPTSVSLYARKPDQATNL